ncbi:MAG TPA: DUF3426 domain-containing protein [Rhizobiales bacterium]|nr:DUF3426 domain-containing protein [Hyphomicrobiales bacterium]
MRKAAGIAGVLFGLFALSYVGLYGSIVGSFVGWLGEQGPGSAALSTWGANVRLLSWLGPLLAIAGGIITFSAPRLGATLLAGGAVALGYLLGSGTLGNVFVIPIGVVAILAYFSESPKKSNDPATENTSGGGIRIYTGFDRAKWNALLQYDEDIRAVADKVQRYGRRWVDKLAAAYLPLNDKAYLQKIEQEVVAAAEAEITAEPPRAHPLATASWSAGILLLLVTLAGQFVYFQSANLAYYPALHPWLERFCGLAGCRVPMPRDLSDLAILDRRVYDDPSAPNALVISLILQNDAAFRQAYPRLQVRFFSLSGRVIALRRFAPREYLPQGADPAAGFQAHGSVPVTLQIVDPGKDAVSYDFEFR